MPISSVVNLGGVSWDLSARLKYFKKAIIIMLIIKNKNLIKTCKVMMNFNLTNEKRFAKSPNKATLNIIATSKSHTHFAGMLPLGYSYSLILYYHRKL